MHGMNVVEISPGTLKILLSRNVYMYDLLVIIVLLALYFEILLLNLPNRAFSEKFIFGYLEIK